MRFEEGRGTAVQCTPIDAYSAKNEMIVNRVACTRLPHHARESHFRHGQNSNAARDFHSDRHENE